MVVEKRNAIQIKPPITGRESSRSKEKLKTTTTTRAKNIMELKTSRDRHSSRRSLVTLIHVSFAMDMLTPFLWPWDPASFCLGSSGRDQPAVRARASGIRQLNWP